MAVPDAGRPAAGERCTGRGVVVATGRETMLGLVAAAFEPPEAPTAFDVGLPPEMLPMIVAVCLVTVQLLKAWLVSRGWID